MARELEEGSTHGVLQKVRLSCDFFFLIHLKLTRHESIFEMFEMFNLNGLWSGNN